MQHRRKTVVGITIDAAPTRGVARWCGALAAAMLMGAQSLASAAMADDDAAAKAAAEMLAQWDGMASYCGKLQPERAEEFAEHVKSMFAGAKEDDVTKARTLPAYQAMRREVIDELGKQDDESGRKACDAVLKGGG